MLNEYSIQQYVAGCVLIESDSVNMGTAEIWQQESQIWLDYVILWG